MFEDYAKDEEEEVFTTKHAYADDIKEAELLAESLEMLGYGVIDIIEDLDVCEIIYV